MKLLNRSLIVGIIFSLNTQAKEFHIAKNGNDFAKGCASSPFLTISKAATIAQPGDTITVHEGIYRERVDPAYGGINQLQRIVYRASEGEKVVIKGSEQVKGWKKEKGTTWKLVLPNSFFASYNPYADLVGGDWFTDKGFKHHTGEVFLNGKAMFEKNNLKDVTLAEAYEDAQDKKASTLTWCCVVDDKSTRIWANFQGLNPNEEMVEINARQACFYPSSPGINFITIQGFTFDQAATQWAAPTAEQIGMIGTHWSKGWIIENNEIRNSKNVGITLGKDRATGHNVWSNNTKKGGSQHYNEVIFRAQNAGWSKEKIGSHVVRDNSIHNCGQAGIVGSLGAVFSSICNNHIYDIWTERDFTGAEMAGIKIHAPIDMLISENCIHNTGRGIWLDWMTQGTRVTKNVLFDNTQEDYFTEVNHGPNMVDNNIFLSRTSIRDWSDGSAFVHNLVAGRITYGNEPNRYTPYHLPHSTLVAGFTNTLGGDNRFYNNIFVAQDYKNDDVDMDRIDSIFYGLGGYEITKFENVAAGNVYYYGADPYSKETDFQEFPEFKPVFKLEESEAGLYLIINLKKLSKAQNTKIVNTQMLGSTFHSESNYENPDGSPLKINMDYFGNERNIVPAAGPFENLNEGENRFLMFKKL